MGAEGQGEPTLRLVQVQGCHLTVGVLWSHARPGAACAGAGVSYTLQQDKPLSAKLHVAAGTGFFSVNIY